MAISVLQGDVSRVVVIKNVQVTLYLVLSLFVLRGAASVNQAILGASAPRVIRVMREYAVRVAAELTSSHVM